MSPEIAAIRAQLAKRPPTAGSFEERRARWEAQFTAICPPLPGAVARREGASGEWVEAGKPFSDTLLLYVHGGGFTAGSAAAYRGLSTRFSQACGCRVFAADYRLAPENPFPAALDDCHAVYARLALNNADIVLIGDSAGGNLAAALLLRLREAGERLPLGAVLISPVLDLALTGASVTGRASREAVILPESLRLCASAYAGNADRRTPMLSPLYADLAGLPPLLIQVGSEELLRDDSVRFADKARLAGVDVTLEEWPDMIHVWHLFAERLAEARAAIARIGEFVGACRATSGFAQPTR